MAAGVAYLRLLSDGGLGVRDALRQISFRFAADDDQFMTIAKLRAARQLWARVAEVVGEPDSGAVTVHGVTSLPMMAERDPWVNMLRTTLAAFGAGVGGAEPCSSSLSTSRSRADSQGSRPAFSRRIARNTQLLLLEESHVGRVLDPAAGSWFVEDLTERLAEQAWTHFREIEQRGGFVEARDFVAEQIAEVRDRRIDDIAHRRTALTGVNEYPNLAEPPLPPNDLKATVEVTRPGLRRCGTARMPTSAARVAPAGAAAAARPARRAQHPRDVRREPAGLGRYRGRQPRPCRGRRCRGGRVGRRHPERRGDLRYRRPLRGRGGRRGRGGARGRAVNGLSGRPGEGRGGRRGGRPDDYLTAKIDAVEALSTLLTRLGA